MKKRINTLSRALKNEGLDAFVTSDSANIQYLTGITHQQGWAVFTKNKEIIYFTLPIYARTAREFPNLDVVVVKTDFFAQLAKKLKRMKLKKIGFFKKNMNLFSYQVLKEKLTLNNIKLIESNPLIGDLRKIKSSREINLIKKAVSVSLEAFDYALEICHQATSEKDLSIELERFLKIKSDNNVAFGAIVASDKNTSLPHHLPGNKIINNFFLIDLGATYYGYCADLTRIFFSGKMPSHFWDAYNLVKKAKDIAISKIKDGAKASDIDKIARDIIDKKGLGKYFLHGLGHGVGLRVHEPPYLRPKSNEILKEGMVLTIEPGIYYKNCFGVRLEDMVIVRSKKGELIS